MAGPLCRRLGPSISRTNEKKMPPTTTMSICLAAAAILFLMDSSQKFIRSSGIPRKQPYQIWMQFNLRFISYRAHKLFRRPSSKMAAYGLVPKKYMG